MLTGFIWIYLTARDKNPCGLGSPEQGSRFCLTQLLDSEATNPFEYEFSFHLEIRGPCLLAGVESPTHEIRADADPSARSAKSIVITLANKHTFDRPVEILIHPSEPHMPHVLMEEGDMTPAEYERYLKGKNDFIKGTKKDPSAKKKVRNTSCRKRLNKDIPHHPVIMLNFCPDLRTVQPGLRKAQGEFIFLVDRSRSMSGVSISRAKVPAGGEAPESLLIACQTIRRIRADMGSINLLSPLKWLLRQPIHRGHPRLLFVLTAGAISNTGKVLELLRDQSCSTRCYSFGLGPNACRRLVRGLAAVSRGVYEFLEEGERLQPKVQSLKKAMAPVLSDVSVEWVFPESTEVLVSPVSSSCLFPGDHLVSYSVICDTSPYLSNPRAVSLSTGAGGVGVYTRVLALSQPGMGRGKDLCDCIRHRGWAGSRWDQRGQSRSMHGADMDQRAQRAVCHWLQPDPNICSAHSPSRPSRMALAPGSVPQAPGAPPCSSAAACPSATMPPPRHCQRGCRKPRQGTWNHSVPSGACTPHQMAGAPGMWVSGRGGGMASLTCPCWGLVPLHRTPCHRVKIGKEYGFVVPVGNSAPRESPQHPSLTFETEASSDWEPQDLDIGAACGSPRSPRTLCRAVVKGLRNNEPVQWEVTFDIHPLFRERESQEDGDTDLWSETFHHLAAKSLIQDLEQLAKRECEIEHGSGRRFQLSAVHTSKACNIISKYTAFVPVDLSTSSYLPTLVRYTHTGNMGLAQGWNIVLAGNMSLRNFSQSKPYEATAQFGTRTPHTQGEQRRIPPKSSSCSVDARASLCARHPLQVSLQLACGAFLLNSAFCDAINIPMEKLKWTSPFACHRLSLSPSALRAEKEKDSRVWDTNGSELQALLFDVELQQQTEPEGMLWATAVALAWLEHSSASYFIEWELVAAKASLWLSGQDFPEGSSLATVKAAAQQLFVLLRHWDENLEFNLLCYNPGSV
uniref:von Willebrand factor A domain containing 5B1 n=1 Tax=Serinus canaria TaxID=9135 RepID=A0A8C9MEC5_SERCA